MAKVVDMQCLSKIKPLTGVLEISDGFNSWNGIKFLFFRNDKCYYRIADEAQKMLSLVIVACLLLSCSSPLIKDLTPHQAPTHIWVVRVDTSPPF